MYEILPSNVRFDIFNRFYDLFEIYLKTYFDIIFLIFPSSVVYTAVVMFDSDLLYR